MMIFIIVLDGMRSLLKEIKLINHNNFYLSGTTIGATNSFSTESGILPAFTMLEILLKILMKTNF